MSIVINRGKELTMSIIKFKQLLNESLKDLLTDTEYHTLNTGTPDDISNNFEDYYRKNRTTTSMKRRGVGASRLYFKLNKPETMVIDGKKADVTTGMKLAYLGSMDIHHIDTGLKQNMTESDPTLEPHQILQKQSDGSFKTNDDGIILPVLSHHENHTWNHVIHVDPISDTNKLEHHTKTPEYPEGISVADLDNIFYYRNNKNSLSKEDHPFVKSIKRLVKSHNISTHDFSSDNIGIWTHPHTGKKYPVLLDFGLKRST